MNEVKPVKQILFEQEVENLKSMATDAVDWDKVFDHDKAASQ